MSNSKVGGATSKPNKSSVTYSPHIATNVPKLIIQCAKVLMVVLQGRLRCAEINDARLPT